MDYTSILNKLRPTEQEKTKIKEISHKIIDFLNDYCKKEGINANTVLVGSVAKGTYLENLILIFSLHFLLKHQWITLKKWDLN